jgi:hypothetical protein
MLLPSYHITISKANNDLTSFPICLVKALALYVCHAMHHDGIRHL